MGWQDDAVVEAPASTGWRNDPIATPAPQPDLGAANSTLARTTGDLLVRFTKAAAPAAQTVQDIANPSAVFEAGMNAGTGLTFGFPASIMAAGNALYQKYALGLPVDPNEVMDHNAKLFTYQPRTLAGTRLSGNIQYPLIKLSEAAETVGHRVTDILGSAPVGTPAERFAPAAGAITEAALNMLPMVLIGSILRRMGGTITTNEDFKNTAKVIAGNDGPTAVNVEAKLRATYEKTGIDPFTASEAAAKNTGTRLELAQPMEPTLTPVEPTVTAYHGSPHEFEQFDASMIGTGEGSQYYGHGLYFAENEATATSYLGSKSPVGQMVLNMFLNRKLAGLSDAEAQKQTVSWAADHPQIGEQVATEALAARNLYKVEIPQHVIDNMLDLDKPLSEQPEIAKRIRSIQGMQPFYDELTGERLFRTMEEDWSHASLDLAGRLQEVGIPGIRYLDAGSRLVPGLEGLYETNQNKTSNFVLFDPGDARIVERNGVPFKPDSLTSAFDFSQKDEGRTEPTISDAITEETAGAVSEAERLASKRALYTAYEATGAPADVVAASVIKAQEKANERGEPMSLWRSQSGALGLVPAKGKSPFVSGELITTVHPEIEAGADAASRASQAGRGEDAGVGRIEPTIGEMPIEPITSNWDSKTKSYSPTHPDTDTPYVSHFVEVDGSGTSPQPRSAEDLKKEANATIGGFPAILKYKEIQVYAEWSEVRDQFPKTAELAAARLKNIPNYEPGPEPDYVRIGFLRATKDGVEHVVVSPQFQRQGLGREMLLTAEREFGVNPLKAEDRSPAGAALLESLRQDRLKGPSDQNEPTIKNPSVEDIHKQADALGIKWDDDPAFMELTKAITGKEKLDDLNPEERQAVYVELNAGFNPASTIEALRQSKLGQTASTFTRAVIDDLQMKLTPMAADTATDRSRAVAKQWANADRKARYLAGVRDDLLKNEFTPEQRAAMGKALDEQSALEQTGQDTAGKGLDTLNDHERTIVGILNDAAKAVWERAKAIGMVRGEGLPSYMPRFIVNIGEDGTVSRVQSKGEGRSTGMPEQVGQNVITSTPNLLKRKYLTPEETEAAAKERFGEGATLVTDIRALPAAIARFERAVAGRELISGIKDIGQRAGEELVSDTEKPGMFTVDHPSFNIYRPRFVTDDETGKVTPAVDQNGDTVFDKLPLYVADEFKGPLTSIMSEKSGAVYRGAMALKGKTMSVIMYSPLIHNEVEFGRAFALMPIEMSKIGLAKGFIPVPKIYLDGNRLKNQLPVMMEAIDGGLVPIGKRFGFQDITGMMEEPNATPGRSWTSQILAAPVSLVSKAAGEAVKRGVDAAGDFYHNTLLWDRVADLQMGLYGKVLEEGESAGLNRQQAVILAAHEANRFAGALPNEVMSANFRKAANIIFFSRTFTGGNIGAMKDAMIGVPRDVVAQLKEAGADAGAQKAAADLAQSFGRRMAIGAVVKDVALAHLGVALVASALEYYREQDFDKILEGYRDRWHRLMAVAAKDPWNASNPFEDLRALSPTSDNEPGKEDRVRIGTNPDGTVVYMRMPTGKIGEEMEGYLTKPIEMMRRKVGTIVRPLIDDFMNDKGFGRHVYDPNAKTVPEMLNAVFDAVMHIALDQFPVDSMEAAKNIVSDISQGKQPKPIDEAKALGPLAGVTFSKGAPGGPAVGEMYHAADVHHNEVMRIRPEVSKLISDGNVDEAIAKMQEAHMTRVEIKMTLRFALDPSSRLSRGGLRKFYQTAPEEEQARMQRMQDAEQRRNAEEATQ